MCLACQTVWRHTLGFLALCAVVLLIVFGIYYSMKNEQKDPATHFIRSARIRWDGNSGEVLNRQLIEAGIDSEVTRYSLLGRRWRELPGDIQAALIKLRIVAELATLPASNAGQDGRSPTAHESALKPQSISYFDAVRQLTMNLSRSIPLSEWATGLPKNYTAQESDSIDSVTRKLPGTPASRYVAEPLQNLVREIALIELARALKEDAWAELGDESWPSEIVEPIASAYLKAWLCNSNPFVLLELADSIAANGHRSEAEEAIQAALKFPQYARTMTMNGYEMVAQTIAFEALPPGPVGRESRSGSDGLYSAETIALLRKEAQRIHERVELLKKEPHGTARDREEFRPNPQEDESEFLFEEPVVLDPRLDPNQTPTPEQVKELWEVWEKEGVEGIRRSGPR